MSSSVLIIIVMKDVCVVRVVNVVTNITAELLLTWVTVTPGLGFVTVTMSVVTSRPEGEERDIVMCVWRRLRVFVEGWRGLENRRWAGLQYLRSGHCVTGKDLSSPGC